MKALFLHDHIVTIKNGKLYSTGGLNEKVIMRYTSLFNEFSLGTRMNNFRDISNLTYISNDKDITYIPLPNLSNISPRNYYKATQILKNHIQNNNIIILRLPSFIGYLGAYLAIKYKKQYAVELGGCPFDATWYFGGLKGKLIAPILYIITRFLIKRSKNVIYVTAQFLQNRYPSNGVNVTNCSNVEITIIQNLLSKRISKITNRDDNVLVVGMIGSIVSKYKGFETALKAIKAVNEKSKIAFNLEIVGGGDSSYLNSLIKENNIENHVTLKGTLPHPDGIFEWLDSIDIYIQPSKVEGLPRALVEAMSRGCPSLGSAIGGIPELLGEEFIHKKNDWKRLAQLLQNFENPEQMIKSAKLSFNAASNYDKIKLDNRRTNFYDKIKSNEIKDSNC